MITATPFFEVPYSASAFGPDIAGNGNLTFSAGELAHALFATGRIPGDQAKFGYASVWEWLHRVSVIPAYIRRGPNNRLMRSRLAMSMDRSEKVSLSYALGQALTGVFSRKILNVRYLMHVDRYARQYDLLFNNTRKRADLFGIGDSGWVVAEAKGRSQAMSLDLPGKLIAQKRSIKAIGGEAPRVAFGCVSSFPWNRVSRSSSLRVDAFDPVEDEVTATTLDASIDPFLMAYYEPFLAAIDMGDSNSSSDHFVAARFEPFRVRLGLLRPIADRVRQARAGQVSGLYGSVKEILLSTQERNLGQLEGHTVTDGTLVETDWEAQLALNDR